MPRWMILLRTPLVQLDLESIVAVWALRWTLLDESERRCSTLWQGRCVNVGVTIQGQQYTKYRSMLRDCLLGSCGAA